MEMQPIPIELFRLKSTTTDEFVAALPGGTAIMSGSFTSGTIEFDADITVTGTSALNGLVTLGIDAATNTAGSIKFWSAGANNFYTTFTAGTQTANATYTLPTAMPATNSLPLICSTAGVMAWSGNFGNTDLIAMGSAEFGSVEVDDITIDDTEIISTGTLGISSEGTLTLSSNLSFIRFAANTQYPDNVAAVFGTGNDATIYYDATNLRINPKAVGSGVCYVDGNLCSRNDTAKTTAAGSYQLHGILNLTATSVGYNTAVIGETYIAPTGTPTNTGYLAGLAGVVRYQSAYNISTSWVRGISLIGVVGNVSFNQNNSTGNVDGAAGLFFGVAEDGAAGKMTGVLTNWYNIYAGPVGAGPSTPIKITNAYGVYIGEIDGNSYMTTAKGLYIGNIHDAATNYAIETNGGIHLLRDAIYFTQTDGAEKIDSDADGTLDLYAGTSINAHGNVFPATDNTYYLGKNDDDTPLAWKGLILKDQAGTGKYYRVEVVDNALTITDLTD